jgi:hypothetical protein
MLHRDNSLHLTEPDFQEHYYVENLGAVACNIAQLLVASSSSTWNALVTLIVPVSHELQGIQHSPWNTLSLD